METPMKRFLIATAMVTLAVPAFAEGELQLYNWGNYTSPELLEKFKAETGITVTVTDYDSNDTALAKVEAGGSGFDLVVPSANYVPIWIEKGLVQELDLSKIPNHANIEPKWMEVAYDPGRKYSIPWQWGTTGVAVNKSVYGGEIGTSAIWLDPPEELKGKINVTPEMNDVLALAIMYEGGEPCTEDLEILKRVRDKLLAAKPFWMSMDYGMEEKMAVNDVSASVYWNGAMIRARLKNPDVVYAVPKEGFIEWMDQVMLLSDAQNVEEAYAFMNFIAAPENAALISNFARYASGISGATEFMDDVMKTAPELQIPAEVADKGRFIPTCGPKAQELYTAIWTELQK
jgi:spermidine/putrescine transport system substrate-binding protein